jgi:hypothetical protein
VNTRYGTEMAKANAPGKLDLQVFTKPFRIAWCALLFILIQNVPERYRAHRCMGAGLQGDDAWVLYLHVLHYMLYDQGDV